MSNYKKLLHNYYVTIKVVCGKTFYTTKVLRQVMRLSNW